MEHGAQAQGPGPKGLIGPGPRAPENQAKKQKNSPPLDECMFASISSPLPKLAPLATSTPIPVSIPIPISVAVATPAAIPVSAARAVIIVPATAGSIATSVPGISTRFAIVGIVVAADRRGRAGGYRDDDSAPAQARHLGRRHVRDLEIVRVRHAEEGLGFGDGFLAGVARKFAPFVR